MKTPRHLSSREHGTDSIRLYLSSVSSSMVYVSPSKSTVLPADLQEQMSNSRAQSESELGLTTRQCPILTWLDPHVCAVPCRAMMGCAMTS